MNWVRISMCVLLFSVVTLNSFGCVSSHPLEKTGLVTVMGYDLSEDDKVLGTAVLHQIDPDAKENVQIVSGTALTTTGLRNKMNQELSKKFASGQLRVVIFNDEIAKKGISDLLDALIREPDIGDQIYLIISKGQTRDLLIHRYPQVSNIGNFLFQAIDQNIKGEQIKSCTLHEFTYSYYSSGSDPTLPILERKGNELGMKKVALFKGDKLVGTISAQESFFLKLISGKFKAGNVELAVDSEKFMKNEKKKINLVVDQLASNREIQLLDPKKPKFLVSITVNARLREISTQVDLTDPKTFKQLEQTIGEKFTDQTNMLIKKAQKIGIDPFGFGESYRSQVRHSNLTKESWREKFKHAEFQTKMDVKILETGLTD